MGRREQAGAEELKVTVEALTGQPGGKGIWGIEDDAAEGARGTKLARRAERSAVYDRGYAGGRRRCPRCRQWQKDKGAMRRAVAVGTAAR